MKTPCLPGYWVYGVISSEWRQGRRLKVGQLAKGAEVKFKHSAATSAREFYRSRTRYHGVRSLPAVLIDGKLVEAAPAGKFCGTGVILAGAAPSATAHITDRASPSV
jgi:hypothetical protein